MINDYLEQSIQTQQALKKDEAFLGSFARAVELLVRSFIAGQKLLIAGNGGSAADSQHFAAEIVNTLKKEKRCGYPAIALTTDTSVLTSWVNDFGADDMFARQVQALGQANDVLFAISTSGNSKNLVRAVEEAKEKKMATIGLLGGNGGVLADMVDIALIVPSDVTSHIQESHIAIIHGLCEEVVPHLS